MAFYRARSEVWYVACYMLTARTGCGCIPGARVRSRPPRTACTLYALRLGRIRSERCGPVRVDREKDSARVRRRFGSPAATLSGCGAVLDASQHHGQRAPSTRGRGRTVPQTSLGSLAGCSLLASDDLGGRVATMPACLLNCSASVSGGRPGSKLLITGLYTLASCRRGRLLLSAVGRLKRCSDGLAQTPRQGTRTVSSGLPLFAHPRSCRCAPPIFAQAHCRVLSASDVVTPPAATHVQVRRPMAFPPHPPCACPRTPRVCHMFASRAAGALSAPFPFSHAGSPLLDPGAGALSASRPCPVLMTPRACLLPRASGRCA